MLRACASAGAVVRLCKLKSCEIYKTNRLHTWRKYKIQISNSKSDAVRFCSYSTAVVKKNVSLVIFDKDGTLICFHAMWGPWANCVAESIHDDSKHPSVDMAMEVYNVLGYCPLTNEVRQGLLAEATMMQIRISLIQLLIKHGSNHEKAVQVVDTAIKKCDMSNKLDKVKPLDDLHRLFRILKENHIKIALCTADNRKQTLTALDRMAVTKYFDMIVCGDDADAKPKPNPHNAHKICRNLNVHLDEAVMVGDTKTDIEFGRSSNLGFTIGVLSGIGRSHDLENGADQLVNRVSDILPLIIKEKPPKSKSRIFDNFKDLIKRFGKFSHVNRSAK